MVGKIIIAISVVAAIAGISFFGIGSYGAMASYLVALVIFVFGVYVDEKPKNADRMTLISIKDH